MDRPISYYELVEICPRLLGLEAELIEAKNSPLEIRRRWVEEIYGEVEHLFSSPEIRETVFQHWRSISARQAKSNKNKLKADKE